MEVLLLFAAQKTPQIFNTPDLDRIFSTSYLFYTLDVTKAFITPRRRKK